MNGRPFGIMQRIALASVYGGGLRDLLKGRRSRD